MLMLFKPGNGFLNEECEQDVDESKDERLTESFPEIDHEGRSCRNGSGAELLIKNEPLEE